MAGERDTTHYEQALAEEAWRKAEATMSNEQDFLGPSGEGY